MRRRTRLGLVIAILLLIAGIGAYTAFWFIVAGKIEDGLKEWAQSARDQKIEASWRGLRVSGFPFAFRVEWKAEFSASTPIPASTSKPRSADSNRAAWAAI